MTTASYLGRYIVTDCPPCEPHCIIQQTRQTTRPRLQQRHKVQRNKSWPNPSDFCIADGGASSRSIGEMRRGAGGRGWRRAGGATVGGAPRSPRRHRPTTDAAAPIDGEHLYSLHHDPLRNEADSGPYRRKTAFPCGIPTICGSNCIGKVPLFNCSPIGSSTFTFIAIACQRDSQLSNIVFDQQIHSCTDNPTRDKTLPISHLPILQHSKIIAIVF